MRRVSNEHEQPAERLVADRDRQPNLAVVLDRKHPGAAGLASLAAGPGVGRNRQPNLGGSTRPKATRGGRAGVIGSRVGSPGSIPGFVRNHPYLCNPDQYPFFKINFVPDCG